MLPGYILFDALLLTVKWSTSSLQTSFGIISAFYRNPALRQLPIEEPDKVSRFPWIVLLLNWSSTSVSSAFARNYNESQRTKNGAQCTVFNWISSLQDRAVADIIQNCRKKAECIHFSIITEVASFSSRLQGEYIGGKTLFLTSQRSNSYSTKFDLERVRDGDAATKWGKQIRRL